MYCKIEFGLVSINSNLDEVQALRSASSFFPTAHFPIQDVSSTDQTHFGAAQTHLGLYNASFWGL
jgi:hypothetical protein